MVLPFKMITWMYGNSCQSCTKFQRFSTIKFDKYVPKPMFDKTLRKNLFLHPTHMCFGQMQSCVCAK